MANVNLKKKLLFFVANPPTATELLQIGAFKESGIYDLRVVDKAVTAQYAEGQAIPADLVAENTTDGATLPEPYKTNYPILGSASFPAVAKGYQAEILPNQNTIKVGEVQQLRFRYRDPATRQWVYPAVTGVVWASSVAAKATVGAGTGIATGVAVGNTIITATFELGTNDATADMTLICSAA